jgi:ring-1,2-phenylacetyl-CoA epoxidase subunit PaaC
LKNKWSQIVGDVIKEAQLHLPEASGYVTQGVHGIHSEHMSYLLADMQSLARQHPGAQW